MAINLLANNINYGEGNLQSLRAANGDNTNVMRQAAGAILNELKDILPGDTLSGILVNKDGNGIQLLLSNNTLLNTALDKDISLAMGKEISFQVSSNQNGQLTLRPMFTNLSNSSTIMTALDAAGIGASDATIEMVDTLMKNSMSIGRDMLGSINRELTMYPNADVKDIIMLHKMDIPVNSSSVNQMHMYNNNNQWMLENVSSAAEELTNVLGEIVAEGSPEAVNILDGMKDLLKPADESITNEAELAATGTFEEEKLEANQVVNGQQTDSAASKYDANTIKEPTDLKPEANNIKEEALNNLSKGEKATVADVAIDYAISSKTGILKSEQASTPLPQSVITDLEGSEGKLQAVNSNNPDTNLEDSKEADINKFNVFDKLQHMDKELLKDPAIREQVKSSLTELLKDNFLMNPKSVGEEKYVKKYYEETRNLAEDLSRIMTENGKSNTDFTKTMTNVRENVNFMNQINEIYNYVQLPLKMNDSQANGDLYVYARKKGRGTGGEDGKLTALLHLSMEHLGNMDIFLTLQEGQKLSTRFCLEKEEMIDFIEAHIDELNKRLQAKGYEVGTTVATLGPDSSKNVIENIVDKDGTNILLSTQSFDARA